MYGILVKVKVGFGEGIGGVVGIDEDFLSVDDFGLFVEDGIDGVVHVLLPVTLIGFLVFPVVGIAR